MKIVDILAMCLRNLWRRKVRTLLTVFGVVIGTCSIVVMISLGVGISEQQMSWINEMGDLTVITVYRDWENQDVKINDEMLESIKRIDNVTAATPFLYVDTYQITLQYKDRYSYQGSLYAVDLSALESLGYTAAEGRLPGESDDKKGLVFGSNAAYQFIDTKRSRNNMIDPTPDEQGRVKDPFVDAMHDKMTFEINDEKHEWGKLDGKVYDSKVRAVAVLAEEESANYQFDKIYSIYMDISYYNELQKAYNKENGIKSSEVNYDQVYVKASSVDTVDDVEAALKELGVRTSSMNSMRDEIKKQMMTIQLVLGGIGGVSMLVAALGITNTMVMSIYERTREIGVMKVLGCKLHNIRSIFLWEAGLIGLIGGIAGIAISYGLSALLNILLASYGGIGYGAANLSIIPLWLDGVGMLFATGVGLLSGFYPANRAVKISALEAIKHE